MKVKSPEKKIEDVIETSSHELMEVENQSKSSNENIGMRYLMVGSSYLLRENQSSSSKEQSSNLSRY